MSDSLEKMASVSLARRRQSSPEPVVAELAYGAGYEDGYIQAAVAFGPRIITDSAAVRKAPHLTILTSADGGTWQRALPGIDTRAVWREVGSEEDHFWTEIELPATIHYDPSNGATL